MKKNFNFEQIRRTKIVVFSLIIILLSGCAKERSEEFAKGHGENLLSISSFKDKVFTLTTEGTLTKGKSTHADNFKSSSTSINNFDLVNFKTSATLMRNIPFKAKANHSYKIQYEFSRTHLVVLKIGKFEDIPFQERTYAKDLGNGELAVPLFGHPVKLFRIEKDKDADGEETSTLIEKKVDTLAEATHFKYDIYNREIFDAIKKIDVFPAKYFDGQWFYAETVTTTAKDDHYFIGIIPTWITTSRVEFRKNPKKLMAINLNAYYSTDEAEQDLKKSLVIPSIFVDYRIKKRVSEDTLHEEKIDDDHPEARPALEREYIELKLAQAHSPTTKDFQTKTPTLTDLEITDQYFSYTLYFEAEKTKIKFAFKKAHRPKKGKNYSRSDAKRFGYFTAIDESMDANYFKSEHDRDKNQYLARFYPNDNVITYRFTHNTPEKFRKIGRQAKDAWNDAFKTANTGIKIEIDETFDVTLGDIRYNIINFIDFKSAIHSPAGLGQELIDHKSGEIVSATANIFVDSARAGILYSLKTYLINRLEKFDDLYIFANTNPKEPILSNAGIGFLTNYQSFLIEREEDISSIELAFSVKHTRHHSFDSEALDKLIKDAKTFQNQKVNSELSHLNQSFNGLFDEAFSEIESTCIGENSFMSYIEAKEQNQHFSFEEEVEIFNSCIAKLMPSNLLPSVVHELGHNFGLRHNFRASSDKENFEKDPVTKLPVYSTSSVMDYLPAGITKQPVRPMPYDIAAISFGYDGNLKTKKYLFCTDQDIGQTDPLCLKSDIGSTPSEVVDYLIDSFFAFNAQNGNRVGKRYMFDNIEQLNLEHTFIPLKQIYEKWRYYLAIFMTENSIQLDNLSPQMYGAPPITSDMQDPQFLKAQLTNHAERTVLYRMKNDPKFGQYYRDYYMASFKIFDFFRKIAMMPARHCMVSLSNGKIELLDFTDLREIVYRNTNQSPLKCSDKSVIYEIQSRNYAFIKEVGYQHENLYKSLGDESSQSVDLREKITPFEVLGLKKTKLFAASMLSTRKPSLELMTKQNMFPNFYDEPHFRIIMENSIISRIADGIPGPVVGIPGPNIIYFPKFKREKNTLIEMFFLMKQGLLIPDKFNSTADRFLPLTPMRKQPNEIIPDGIVTLDLLGQIFYAVDQRGHMSHLINTAGQLKATRDQFKNVMNTIPSDVIEHNLKILISKLELLPPADIANVFESEDVNKDELETLVMQTMNLTKRNISVAKAITNGTIEISPDFRNLLAYQNFGEHIQKFLQEEAEYLSGFDSLLQRVKRGDTIDTEKLFYSFSSIGLSERISKFMKEHELTLQAIHKYYRDLNENEAKLDLLSEIIMFN